ncbi:hypothetical protein ACSS6W_000254 [Trichoderma asperelloides]
MFIHLEDMWQTLQRDVCISTRVWAIRCAELCFLKQQPERIVVYTRDRSKLPVKVSDFNSSTGFN